MNTPELKPCPFCGHAAKIHTVMGSDFAECSNAECSLSDGFPVEMWNTRPTEDLLRATIDDMSDANKILTIRVGALEQRLADAHYRLGEKV